MPRLIRVAGLAAVLGVINGCSSPFADRDSTTLRRSISQSAGRELLAGQLNPQPMVTTRESRVEALNLPTPIYNELSRTSGPASFAEAPAPVGPGLIPGDRPIATVTLERAVRSAVSNNLDLQFARLSPAISEARVVAAEAAFDWVFFDSFQWDSRDDPRVASSSSGGITGDQRQVVGNTVGLRRKVTTGGQFTAQSGYTYTDSNTPNLTLIPNPSNEPNVQLQMDQPLLRNFGSDVALAQVRLNKNAERDEVQKLKTQLIKTVADTEQAYWDLVKAHHDLKIFQRLYEQGEDVRKKLEARLGFDIKPSQYAQAVAQVEQRRTNILRGQRSVTLASTKLKQLMNDPEITVGSEFLIMPADQGIDAPVQFNLADAAMLAMANRPEIQRALLSIDDTSIRLQLADNARLPLLDLQALTRFGGLGSYPHNAFDSMIEDNFVSFLVGLKFETPLGNREAEAGYRVRRLEQSQSVFSYRSTLQGVVKEVKDALADVATNYALIGQARAARYAAAEDLRTLEVEERTIQGYTSDFLDRKLRSQNSLAISEQEEMAAVVDYNASLARLFSTMGTSLERNRISFNVADPVQAEPTSPLYPAYPLP